MEKEFKGITFYVDEKFKDEIIRAAKDDRRTISSYIRNLIALDIELRVPKKLVNEQ